MNSKVLLPLIVTILILSACAWARPERAPQAQRTATPAPAALDRRASGVSYDSLPGIDPQLTSLDIYAPASGDRLPVILFVHGGGWAIGDKQRVALKPAAFNQQGFVFISVNYPLVPEITVDGQAQELARAVAWVYENAAQFGGDPAHIFLMGHSAGAHLVSLVGTDPSYLQQAGLDLNALSGVVSLDTRAYDIPRMFQEEQVGIRIYRRAFGDDPATWKKLSPITYIQAGSGIPPFAVAYSGQAGVARSSMAEDFVGQLQAAGVQAVLLPAPSKTHKEINQQFGDPDDPVTQAVMAFLRSALNK
jgi:arylformamidase